MDVRKKAIKQNLVHFCSEIQNVNEIVSEMQLKDFSDEENAIEFMPVYVEPKTPLPMILNEVAGVTTPVAKTSKIFAPRTEDMDSGFLMPDSNQMFTGTNSRNPIAYIQNYRTIIYKFLFTSSQLLKTLKKLI